MRHFLNLTCGLEYLPELPPGSYAFLRIQSTTCEQGRWDFLLQDLDHNFLMALALGGEVAVYDTSRKRTMSFALLSGLALVEYVLRRLWYGETTVPFIRRQNVSDQFDRAYRRLEERTLRKLRYFERYADPARPFTLLRVCRRSLHDGDDGAYRAIARGGPI